VVFKNKLDELGAVTRNKVRLVVHSYNQEQEIDYQEPFASVLRIKAIHILVVFAGHMEIKLYQMYVKSAFLNRCLKKKVYVTQPPGFENYDLPNHVFKLHGTLYGLK